MITPSLVFARCRRALLALLLAVTMLALPTPAAPVATAAESSQEFLLVSDPAAEAVYIYRASDHQRTGQLDDLALSGHGGTLQLPNGHLIAVDDKAGRVLEIKVSAAGRPAIVQSVDIPGDWEGTAWASADARLRYFAVSGGTEGDPTITIVDLRTFAVHQIAVEPRPDSSGAVPEVQVYLAGRPLQLVYTTGGAFHTVPLNRILTNRQPKVTSTAPVGPSTHGPVISRSGDAVYSTTADGLDGASISGATLTAPISIAYSSTRDVVQMYRPRLAADNRTIWGSVAENTGLSATQWADTRSDVNVIDTVTKKSRLLRLPDGIAGRLALSSTYAAVTTIHPDGDVLTLIDTQPGSATYRRIVGTVALPRLSDGPVAGSPASGTQSHASAISPSGGTVYVTNGGDGEVSVIDTATRRIVATLSTPSALSGGGYLSVIKRGTPVTDLFNR